MPATAQVRIAADTKQFKRAMDDVNDRITLLGKLSRGVGNSIRGALSFAGNTAGLTVFAGIPAVLGASAKAFSKFESDMMEVYTLLPNANKAFFEEMKRDALAFSEEFGIMPEEVAKGMYQAISSGQNPAGLDTGFLKIAQEAALAGVTDLRTSVDALTNVVNSYGEGVYDMQYVSDLMFKSVAMSKTTFRELSDYMYQILPTAGSLKLRLDDLFGSISALAATGTLTRVGTTQLRQFLIEISRQGDKANMAFLQASQGVPFEEYIKQGGRLVDVVRLLGDYAKSRQVSLRNLFGSVEAGNAALTLAKSDSFIGMVDALEDPSGAQAQATAKMQERLGYRMARITRTSMNNFIKLGQVMKPVFVDILDFLEQGMNKVRDYDWAKLGRQFEQQWTFIKKLVKDDELFAYLGAQLQLAMAKAAKATFLLMKRLFDSLAGAFSMNENSLGGLMDALMGVASAFVDQIIHGMAKLSPMLISGLSPFIAFFAASIDRIKAKLTFDTEESRKKVQDEKVASFKRRKYGVQGALYVNEGAFAEARDIVQRGLKEHYLQTKDVMGIKDYMGMDVPLGDPMMKASPGMGKDGTGTNLLKKIFGDSAPDAYGLHNDKLLPVLPIIQEAEERLKDAFTTNIRSLNNAIGDSKFGEKISVEDLTPERLFGTKTLDEKSKFDRLTERLERFIQLQQKLKNSAISDAEGARFGIAETAAKGLLKNLDDFERAVMIVMQNADELKGLTPEISLPEIVFKDKYKEHYQKAEDAAEQIKEALDERGSETEARNAQKLKTALAELVSEIKNLKIQYKGLKLAPETKDSLFVKEMGNRIDAFTAMKNKLEEKILPESEFMGEAPENKGAIFERNDPILGDYAVRGFIPSVAVDSKTKIGAGGGFFGFNPEDRLIDSQLALRNSIDALKQSIDDTPVLQSKIEEGERGAMDAKKALSRTPMVFRRIETLQSFFDLLDTLQMKDFKKSLLDKNDRSEQANMVTGFMAKWNKSVPQSRIGEDVAFDYSAKNFKEDLSFYHDIGNKIAQSFVETTKAMKASIPVYDEKGEVVQDESKLLKELNRQFQEGFTNFDEFLDLLTILSKTSSGNGLLDSSDRENLDSEAPTTLERFNELQILRQFLETYNKGTSEHGFPMIRTLDVLKESNLKVADKEPEDTGAFKLAQSRIDPMAKNATEIIIKKTSEIKEVTDKVKNVVQPVNRVFSTEDKRSEPPAKDTLSPSKLDTSEPDGEFNVVETNNRTATIFGTPSSVERKPLSNREPTMFGVPITQKGIEQSRESESTESNMQSLVQEKEKVATRVMSVLSQPKDAIRPDLGFVSMAETLQQPKRQAIEEQPMQRMNQFLMDGATAQKKASDELLNASRMLSESIKEKIEAYNQEYPVNF